MSKKALKNIRWSFSTLHMYEQCPYAFYLKKIEGRDEEQNFFAENGLAMHEVFADLLNNKYTVEDAPEKYEEKYEAICSTTKQSTMDGIFEKCINYLCQIEPLHDRYETLLVENKIYFKVEKYDFTGIVDCVFRDKDTGEVWLVDHKSSDHFMKRDGVTPLKAQEENFYAYKHQMYLYCHALKEKGINVDKICWHHFKDGGALTVIPFEQEEYESTLKWAIGLIHTIEIDRKYESLVSKKEKDDSINTYLKCGKLCGFRHECEYF